MIPIIHNVVATIQIQCKYININQLHRLIPYSSYDRRKFAAITIRLQNPLCTCLLFTSGKLVVTGANSWDEALLTGYCIRDILLQYFPHSTFDIKEFDIQNIVAHVELSLHENQQLNLPDFYIEHSSESTYQPKMFPGLIFRSRQTKVVLLCFTSGKIVITGAASESEIRESWNLLQPIISKYIITVDQDASG